MEHKPHYDDAVPLVAVLRIAADEIDADAQPKMVELLRQAGSRIEELEVAKDHHYAMGFITAANMADSRLNQALEQSYAAQQKYSAWLLSERK